MASKFKELVSKYGRVAVAVHLSVSAVSFTSCYFAIKNNVDVDGILKRAGLLPDPLKPNNPAHSADGTVAVAIENAAGKVSETIDNAASKVFNGGGALAMAFLCNKALLPVRVPLTVVITPPIARVWAQRRFFRRT